MLPPPDAGPAAFSAQYGCCTLGVRPWVANYNVPLVMRKSAASSQHGNAPQHTQPAEAALIHLGGKTGWDVCCEHQPLLIHCQVFVLSFIPCFLASLCVHFAPFRQASCEACW
jgi:hypothetical protein